MSAEVADGSCAGVRPDAAAYGDVFEDVDALVCESIEESVFVLLWSECDDALAYLLAFCFGSSPSIAAYVAMNALCQAAHVKDGHNKGVAPFCPSGRNTSVKYLCRIPMIALEAPIQLCKAAL